MRWPPRSTAWRPAPIVQPPAPPPAPPARARRRRSRRRRPPLPIAGGATIVAGKPSIQSADGRFTANLHAVMQFDAADYYQDNAGPAHRRLPPRRRGDRHGARPRPQLRHQFPPRAHRHRRQGLRRLGLQRPARIRRRGRGGRRPHPGALGAVFRAEAVPLPHRRLPALDRAGGPGLDQRPAVPGAAGVRRHRPQPGRRRLPRGRRALGRRRLAGMLSGAVTGRLVGVVNSQATGVAQPFDSQLGFDRPRRLRPDQDRRRGCRRWASTAAMWPGPPTPAARTRRPARRATRSPSRNGRSCGWTARA